MEGSKAWLLVVLLSLILLAAKGDGAGCNTLGLAPCLAVAQKGGESKPIPQGCCNKIQNFTPKCLCDSVQSKLAKQYKVDIATAMGIPKRCKIQFDVPPNYTCAGYKVPKGYYNLDD